MWNPRTGAAFGVITGGFPGGKFTAVTPLLHPRRLSKNKNRVPGLLHDPDMYSMHVITGG